MCLKVNRVFHPIAEPLIAQQDILVYKYLNKKTFGFETPYRCYPIRFKFKKYYKYPETKIGITGSFECYEGIHSFKYNARMNNLFCAIIPKGSEFYVGYEDDIVSNNLTIYKNKTEFKDAITFTKYFQKYKL